VWIATGHQMAGLKTATGTGLLLAQLMTGETPRFDPEPFRADQPTLRWNGPGVNARLANAMSGTRSRRYPAM